ncbi:hypothetical protein GQ457_02G034240 [Hibiscus cannabinus]
MATVCSTSQVEDRLHAWGLHGVTVKYMGGCKFLIDIMDQELFSQLQVQEWAILKEVFSEIETWTDLFHLPERITWIQVTSVPLHCWNLTTFKRIADSWGSLISLGENASQFIDCEKVTLLISTKQRERISEVIEVEVGRDCFLVQVDEFGLNLHSKQSVAPNHSQAKKNVEFSSYSSSDSVQSTAPANKTHFNCNGEDEVAKAICSEKVSLVDVSSSDINEGRSLGEKDLLRNLQSDELSSHNQMEKNIFQEAVHSESNVATQAHRPSTQLDRPVGENNIISWADVVAKNLVAQGDGVGEDVTQLQNRRDTESAFYDLIDKANSVLKHIQTREGSRSSHSEEERAESTEDYLPSSFKLDRLLKKIKGKRYGSLRDFQDRVLTDVEKKRRDRALRRIKKKDIQNASLEIDVTSLSSSDLRHRQEILIRKARSTIEFGKQLGFEIEGDTGYG